MKECPACRRCFPDEVNHCPQDGDETLQSISGEPILDGRYQLERRVGQGGMGVVFQARHIFLKTPHAIKIILPDLVGNDPNLITRFRQEALAAAAIRHPNIIAVTDFGVVRGTMPFLVMEFVKGISLQDVLAKEKCLPPGKALEIMAAVCGGVAAAHRQNIVHRDLKPLNIMLQEGLSVSEGLKILDFGLAKIKSGELLGSFVQAKTSGLMGSPFYMAPEQWSDEEPDARADIYSLGVILYQMLGGDVPFKGSSIPAIMKKHLTDPPPPLESLGTHVPKKIEAVVFHALEKNPDHRPQSAVDFIDELRNAVNSSAFTTTREEAPTALLVAPQPGFAGGATIAAPLSFKTVLKVHSQPPESRVFLNSLSLGTTDESGNLSIEDVEPGVHNIRVVREGFSEWESNVECKGGECRVDARLQTLSPPGGFQSTDFFAGTVASLPSDSMPKLSTGGTMTEAQGQASQPNLFQTIAQQGSTSAPRIDSALDKSNQDLPAPRLDRASLGGNAQQRVQKASPTGSLKDELSARPKKSLMPFVLIGSLIVLVILSIAAYLIIKPKPSPSSVKTVAPITNSQAPSATTKPELVAIPGGTFLMGRNGGPPQEAPAHSVKVEAFAMDKMEVTNAEYADFVKNTNYSPPPPWVAGKPVAGQEQWPVANVTPEDARAFAEWRSKRDGTKYRLPSEEEWEYAARGGDEDNLYPWGNSWAINHAATKDSGALNPQPVGSYPSGKTRWGVLDMIGNVWEWTSTNASLYPGNTGNPISASQKDWVIARGGSFLAESQGPKAITATYRDWFAPSTKSPYIGFRLVRPGS